MQFTSFAKFTLSLFLLFLGTGLAAQKQYKVLSLPPALDYIKDEGLHRTNYTEITSVGATRGETPGRLWMVVSDRVGTKAYDRPEGSKVLKELEFKEGPFYVMDQKDDWVEIVKGKPVGKVRSKKVEGAYYGWVRKSEMLMWPTALRSGSGIHKYVFILVREADIRNLSTLGASKAALYNSPGADKNYSSINIFSFYNILKEEGDRYLIASLDDGRLPGIENQIKDAIKGWVKKDNTTAWNTRVVLEPNFTQQGFEERKGKNDYRLVGYSENLQAGQHARYAKKQSDNITWEADPVTVNEVQLAKEGGKRRYLGKVMRFPMLSRGATDASTITFKSGIIGDVMLENKKRANEGEIAAAEKILKKIYDDHSNVNFLFAIQGTSNMAKYKNDIVEAIGMIGEAFSGGQAKLSFGGVVYHNITDDDGTDQSLAEIFPLSESKNSLSDFVAQASFDNKNSDAARNFPATNYGINQLLRKANLNKDHTNVLILIGSDGDFSANKRVAPQFSSHRASVPLSEVIASAEAINANIFSIPIILKDKSGFAFLDLGEDLIGSSAVGIYNRELRNSLSEKYIGTVVDRPVEPYLDPAPDEIEKPMAVTIQKSCVAGGIVLPADGASVANLTKEIMGVGGIIKERVDADFFIYQSYKDGKDLAKLSSNYERTDNNKDAEDDVLPRMSAGDFSAQVQSRLAKVIAQVNIPPEMLGNRYQLYEEVYFPREIKGASAPTMSYVLFMGTEEVNHFIDAIRNIVNVASRETSDDQRVAVIELYANLYGFFTGNINKDKVLSLKIKEINSQMFGMQTEGLPCPSEAEFYCNLQLTDVLDENLMSDEDVEKLLTHFKEVGRYLDKEVFRSDYEFIFESRTGREYYWVPITYLY